VPKQCTWAGESSASLWVPVPLVVGQCRSSVVIVEVGAVVPTGSLIESCKLQCGLHGRGRYGKLGGAVADLVHGLLQIREPDLLRLSA